MYPSLGIANYFLNLAWQSGQPLTHPQLQKLIYIAHGWHLGIRTRPLIMERIEAWSKGPGIRVVYDEFGHYGTQPITKQATILSGIVNGEFHFTLPPTISQNDTKTKSLVDEVWKVYGHMSGAELSARTHQEGTPWYKVWHDESTPPYGIKVIGDDLIRLHYQRLLTNAPQ